MHYSTKHHPATRAMDEIAASWTPDGFNPAVVAGRYGIVDFETVEDVLASIQLMEDEEGGLREWSTLYAGFLVGWLARSYWEIDLQKMEASS
jgi:hypothetical protein